MHPSTKGVRGRRHQVTPLESAGSWKQLRQRFLSSTLSLRALAREAGVSYDALKRRARRERWAALRVADVCTARRRRDLEELARRCIERLRHGCMLADYALQGAESVDAIEYLGAALRVVIPLVARPRAKGPRTRRR